MESGLCEELGAEKKPILWVGVVTQGDDIVVMGKGVAMVFWYGEAVRCVF